MSELLPLFLKLEGREVLLVGGGPIADGKLTLLLSAGAVVTVVAPELRETVRTRAHHVNQRAFTPSDLDAKWLVVSAAPGEVNAAVSAEAERRRLFVLAVDQPRCASAYGAGVVRRGGVTLAISTDGTAPALAGLLREALEAVLPDELSQWSTVARDAREAWKGQGIPMAERRPLLLEALNTIYSRREKVSA